MYRLTLDPGRFDNIARKLTQHLNQVISVRAYGTCSCVLHVPFDPGYGQICQYCQKVDRRPQLSYKYRKFTVPYLDRGARIVRPYHYHNRKWPADLNQNIMGSSKKNN
jgi:hypothetical protein